MWPVQWLVDVFHFFCLKFFDIFSPQFQREDIYISKYSEVITERKVICPIRITNKILFCNVFPKVGDIFKRILSRVG